MEHTLAMIKPDAVRNRNIGNIIACYEKAGLKVVAMKYIQLSKKDAEKFYAVHKSRPFFDSLTTFMSSGPIVALALQGENAITKTSRSYGCNQSKRCQRRNDS